MRFLTHRWCLTLSLASILTLTATADMAAQERPYTEGSVWDVTYVKTAPGQFDAYLGNLQQVWKKVNDQAVEKGYILSYKILTAPAGFEGDWDLLLMVEYPNMAAFDGIGDRFDPLAAAVLGDLDQQSRATVERSQLRVIQGSKLARELTLKE